MDVLALLDKLDGYLSECSRMPLVGKLLVDEDEVFGIIDDLRAALPQELEQAKWLLKERERILQEARKEAEDIVKDAQGQIASLASESIIAKEARAQADELMDRAREVAQEINAGAREYADDVMKKVEECLADLLSQVQAGRRELAPVREAAAAVAPEADEEQDDEEIPEADLKDALFDDEDDKPRKRRLFRRD
jgi:cell division septum initiation protein DivIVA